MKYRQTDRKKMVEQFEVVRNRPEPKAVFFTCMDSRMIPTRFTETNVGDMFVVRNAGNLIPHSQHFLDEATTTEPAALELGCIVNDIKHIIVCGHSDCKAMNLLYSLQCQEFSSQKNRRISPLRAWLSAHASSSLSTFQQLEISGYQKPLIFQAETPMRKFVAYIDPEDNFSVADKLSQVAVRKDLFGTVPLLVTSECHWLYVLPPSPPLPPALLFLPPPPPPILYFLAPPLIISLALCCSQTVSGLEHGLV
ncbi:hypothetical protein B7P43_G08694 [Cryptotermes secundus]|uniref:Carbonic anhydrase n=1 Tax=Cryptotermes secundus TaxID=105785 RepID=A0A2J7R5Y0_9NEOP|nr:hypothetical protein B7P43_G08694 [Cryptotermes secundus]